MKMTLTTNEIANALFYDGYSNWSFQGAWAVADFLEEMEAELGEEQELDVVDIRCSFSEYNSILEACHDYNLEITSQSQGLQALREHTTVIEVDGSNKIIVQAF